jgi:ABC-type transport system involved in multi-copper enzyme maturation permease subunit
MSKALTDKEGQRPLPPDWGPEETAPSVLREDEPSVARLVGGLGAFLIVVGAASLARALAVGVGARPPLLGVGWAFLFLVVGVGGLLFHAAFDRDIQFRRVYAAFAGLCLAVGAFLCFLPHPKIGDLFGPGFLCMALALPFFLTFHRNETEPGLRNVVELTLGVTGVVLAAVGLFGGSLRASFLLPTGLLLACLGLAYLVAFVAARGISDDLGFWGALALGAAGLLAVGAALVRSFVVGKTFFMPQGALLLVVGAVYALVSAGLWSERPVVAMMRRELGAFFYSPIAYLTLFGFTLIAWIQYWFFVQSLLPSPMGRRSPVIEPIVRDYVGSWLPIFFNLLVVPILTMRLLSEERRSGTLEVLLTAPVNETQVVLSKFFAAVIMYVVTWLPFLLFLAAIPLGGGGPFDYRPLLSFFVGLIVTGAAFCGMGLFFSSLTKNQIAAVVLTFAGMIALTAVQVARNFVTPEGGWDKVLTHLSYLEVWTNTLEGRVVLRNLLFYISMAIFWPFLTVKVLEARKWL